MKLTKENVYVNLQGKTKEELTDLWEFLNGNGEKPLRGLKYFLDYEHANGVSQNIGLDYQGKWSNDILGINKTEVTIEQLKEILQPMYLTMEQQLQKAAAEVKRLQSLIEEENKPKIGDWVKSKINDTFFKFTSLDRLNTLHVKITNPELIKLLEDEVR